MKKKNIKGMTLTEIVVSIGLISIVLIFLMNLFLNVNRLYKTSKVNADYDMQISRIIKAVGDDIDKYGLYCIKNVSSPEDKSDTYVLMFNEKRAKKSENIKKVLSVKNRVFKRPDSDTEERMNLISYGYEDNYTKDISGPERITKVTSEIPKDASLGGSIGGKNIILTAEKNMIELTIPIFNSAGTNYSINIYGMTSKSSINCTNDEIKAI